MNVSRRLAGILVADVVGYSKLVGNDEAGTLGRLQALRAEVIEPQVVRHAGRGVQVGRRWFPGWPAIQQVNAEGLLPAGGD